MIPLNRRLKEVLGGYLKKRNPERDEFIFCNPFDRHRHLSRSQAYRIISKAAKESLENPKHISCHSLRKTFGYQAWKKGVQPALLMNIFNHSSYTVTQRYLGISQDERDQVFQTVVL